MPSPGSQHDDLHLFQYRFKYQEGKRENEALYMSQYQIYTGKMKFNCSLDLLPVTAAQGLK